MYILQHMYKFRAARDYKISLINIHNGMGQYVYKRKVMKKVNSYVSCVFAIKG